MKCEQSRLYFGGCQIFTTKKFSFILQAAKDVKAEIGVYRVKLCNEGNNNTKQQGDTITYVLLINYAHIVNLNTLSVSCY